MKLKLTLAVATALAVACSAWLGYRAGRERPHVFWRIKDNPTTTGSVAFGWDNGNRCVAVWWYDTNGVPSGWERLEQ